MTIQRPLGPIGHCSARLRRALEIEEEQALGRAIRVRPPAKDQAIDKTVRGSRWSRPANFAVPGAFAARFVSASGKVTFHCSVQAVSKTSDGGCSITTPKGSKRLAVGAPSQHDGYIERPGAVETTIDPASFDGYSAQSSAVETMDETRAIISNIAPTLEARQRYWRAVHEHERTPGPDRLTLVPENASRKAWRRLAASPDVPDAVCEIAATFATVQDKRKTRTVELSDIGLERRTARALVTRIAALLDTAKGKRAVRLSEGRGGRSQYRFTAEFPDGLDAAARLVIAQAFCAIVAENGLMYVAAIHAPDHHNDRRNHHLHLAFHDRPARMIGDRWDFEIAEPVEGQSNRVRYPHRQPKTGDWSRDPDGGNHREHGRRVFADMRTCFADLCNNQLERLNITRKFHPGDLKSLGCEREPQRPLGPRAAPLEAVGVPTSTGIGNAEALWSALVREAWEAAELRAKQRAQLRRRLADAERSFDPACDEAQWLTADLRDLGARLDRAEAVLGPHDGELAEYDVTLAMARARPDKALDTCRRILAAIDDGEASRAEERARPAITARAGEAEAFLAGIAAIEHSQVPVVASRRAAVHTAQADVDVIVSTASTLLEQDVPALLTASRTKSDNRAVVEALFVRIMAEDMPILPPGRTGGNYRVPGISRTELAAIASSALTDMAQKRLAALAGFQVKRMQAAARIIATSGLDATERAAARGDAGAARTMKHARAYADHPEYRQAIRDAQSSLEPQSAEMPSASQKAGAGWISVARDRFAGLVGRDQSAAATAASTKVTQPVAERPAQSARSTTRDDAIAAFTTALLAEPGLRVIDGSGGLHIDVTAAPEWSRSAEAFADEPTVRDAALQRHHSPWLDMPASERDQLLIDLQNELRIADRRPVSRIEGRWHVTLADDHFTEIISSWRGHEKLERVLDGADRHWSGRERYAATCPTSVEASGSVMIRYAGRERFTGGVIREPAVQVLPVQSLRPARGDIGR